MFDKELGRLRSSLETQHRLVGEHTKFHAELYIQSLRARIFDTFYEPFDEMDFNAKERVFVSPRDRWQRQFRPKGPIDSDPSKGETDIKSWRPLRWISDHLSRRNVSWVSSLCVDLIPYFKSFSNFDVVYVFCKRGQGERYRPTLLIKGLIAQLLDAHPIIAMKNARLLSLARFQEIGKKTTAKSAGMAWQLLDDTLRMMEEAPDLQGRLVLVLIDRLDLCISEPGFSVLNDLIPRLQNLSRQRVRVQVMITTARLSAFGVPTLRKESNWLQAHGKKMHG